MAFSRCSGILLHPTSHPGRYGIGELGREAYQFIDFLAQSGQKLWQILPLGPTGYGNSPYMSFSAIAGNHLLISLDILREKNLLSEADFEDIPDFPLDQVDFDKLIAWKIPLLRKAASNFVKGSDTILYKQFAGFCGGNADWLEDYALFMALSHAYQGKAWMEWPTEIRERHWGALETPKQELQEEIFLHKFLQFEFFEQWLALKRYANSLGIEIIGDIPIYVSHNSADVWANPQVFRLDPQTGNPLEVAGVPPDYFSATGQLWGNPLYNWDYLKNTGFDWWVRRLKAVLSLVDVIRIDHFRGLEAYWAVAFGQENAINGRWLKAPGYDLFNTIRDRLGKLPIIAEDLGDIDQAVLDFRDHFAFPGMKILHFAFGGDAGNPYLPFNVERNCVIYTGTHDNNTTVGWFQDNANDYEKARLYQYLGAPSGQGVAWDLIRLAYSSVANQAIVPLQDVLGLGSDARMNTPSVAEGNWSWRYRQEALTTEYSDRLRDLVNLFGRNR
ncbi:MAG: 4-alpha-glucanotransferase [Chroococcales cyanobacterium metabat2.561]|jgi:4-alpha-glucanotransferase|uniref:4-alpha-glucanotransferase n=1 Tax=Microcystis aeruginosa Ma_SC_T_19800800_S464 TaxID=2486257 RepID=A0A552DT53_MICAE|nr:MAG: 4-alpha-glucanotransferase [Chroococcales cyanobacterium metabat2.561]TRU25397.1 MAG: 4-alpha-glucanotransferase [Microcystis aeruginosa Ma_SC_T_19800800_S464]